MATSVQAFKYATSKWPRENESLARRRPPATYCTNPFRRSPDPSLWLGVSNVGVRTVGATALEEGAVEVTVVDAVEGITIMNRSNN